jgi:lactate dehydrogenase-like 2-hydroxyacid dehydrogenase
VKPELLIVAPLISQCMVALDQRFILHRLWEAPDPRALLESIAPNVKGIVTNGALGAGRELINSLPNLEIIAVSGVGVDAIDLRLAKERGISVTSTPDVLTEDVADMALALLLAASRQIVPGDQYVRSGRWAAAGGMPLTHRVNGKRAGILGLGRIGKALAKRLEALNMKISYHNRKKQDLPYTYYPELQAMAGEVDFLVAAAAGGEGTRELVSRKVLEALGPGGIFVNVSRGSVVDEKALVELLREGKLRGAGLDVFESEPNVREELKSLPNVVLQPHHSSGTIETRSAMGALAIRNLEAHFARKPLPTPYEY